MRLGAKKYDQSQTIGVIRVVGEIHVRIFRSGFTHALRIPETVDKTSEKKILQYVVAFLIHVRADAVGGERPCLGSELYTDVATDLADPDLLAFHGERRHPESKVIALTHSAARFLEGNILIAVEKESGLTGAVSYSVRRTKAFAIDTNLRD